MAYGEAGQESTHALQQLPSGNGRYEEPTMQAMTAAGRLDTDVNRQARKAAINAAYMDLAASGRTPTLKEREALIMAAYAYEQHPYRTTTGSDAVRQEFARRALQIHQTQSRQQALHDDTLAGSARIADPVMRESVTKAL